MAVGLVTFRSTEKRFRSELFKTDQREFGLEVSAVRLPCKLTNTQFGSQTLSSVLLRVDTDSEMDCERFDHEESLQRRFPDGQKHDSLPPLFPLAVRSVPASGSQNKSDACRLYDVFVLLLLLLFSVSAALTDSGGIVFLSLQLF